jgi:hypothetical protein
VYIYIADVVFSQTDIGRLCDGLGVAARQTEPKPNNEKLQVTFIRLIFIVMLEQKFNEEQSADAAPSASPIAKPHVVRMATVDKAKHTNNL